MIYSLTRREHIAAKSRLTKAQKRGDPGVVIAVCNNVLKLFEEKGFPDDWARWERARDDARVAEQRRGKG
jgi:hypothetical protein